jgi:hypothetical protein
MTHENGECNAAHQLGSFSCLVLPVISGMFGMCVVCLVEGLLMMMLLLCVCVYCVCRRVSGFQQHPI